MALNNLINKALEGRQDNDGNSWRQKLPSRVQGYVESLYQIRLTSDQFPNPRRGGYYDETTNFVGCDVRTFRREEAYSRALYNLKTIWLDESDVDLVDYEVRVAENCKLDLLGKSTESNTYYAIEYKLREGGSTDLEYALLESLGYSILLSRKINEQSIVKYLVAGPLSYFLGYLKLDENASDPKHYRRERIVLLENEIQNISKTQFSGYFVVADMEKTLLKRKIGDNITPHYFLQVKSAETMIESVSE